VATNRSSLAGRVIVPSPQSSIQMLIINADDFGRSGAETDAALRCYQERRITSVSAMVFMADSERAAERANESRLDVGLHLNFTERFTAKRIRGRLPDYHDKIARFLTRNRYSQILYNPWLRAEFSYSCEAQIEEFSRLFAKPPSHIDGHHHMHLCGNMLLSSLIPAGMKIRRNFSFWPGEKSWLNRAYRALVDRWLAQRYQLTDYFFDLTQSIREKKMNRIVALSASSKVELMTHPILELESDYLTGDQFHAMLQGVNIGTYALV
jgi:chitin disaccharide deacetylase